MAVTVVVGGSGGDGSDAIDNDIVDRKCRRCTPDFIIGPLYCYRTMNDGLGFH